MTQATADPFELLVRANPVPDESTIEVPGGGLARAIDRRPARRRLRFRWWGPPVAVVIGVASAAGYVVSRDASQPSSIGCYAGAALDADAAIVQGEPAEAVATCAELWRTGQVVADRRSAPPLHVCVLPSGALGVFPGEGDGTCRRIGAGVDELPGGAPPAPAPEPESALALRDRLAGVTATAGACLDPAAARAAVESAFDDLGLRSWTVAVGGGASGGGFDAERPCVTFGVDGGTRVVTLVPSPGGMP